jgi:hypothetical protein
MRLIVFVGPWLRLDGEFVVGFWFFFGLFVVGYAVVGLVLPLEWRWLEKLPGRIYRNPTENDAHIPKSVSSSTSRRLT